MASTHWLWQRTWPIIARGLSSISDNARVVLFIDDHKSSRLCVGTREEPLQQVKVYDRNLCATDEEDMGIVLADILRDYPAEHYGLVLWSHASGWMFQNNTHAVKRRSFGIDNGQRIGDSSNSKVHGDSMVVRENAQSFLCKIKRLLPSL